MTTLASEWQRLRQALADEPFTEDQWRDLEGVFCAGFCSAAALARGAEDPRFVASALFEQGEKRAKRLLREAGG
jgi:hypothetical protein